MSIRPSTLTEAIELLAQAEARIDELERGIRLEGLRLVHPFGFMSAAVYDHVAGLHAQVEALQRERDQALGRLASENARRLRALAAIAVSAGTVGAFAGWTCGRFL